MEERLTVHIPSELKNKIEDYAKKNYCSVGVVIRQLIDKHIVDDDGKI
jgi:hypothetical protein